MSPADSLSAQLPAPGPHPVTAELRAYAAGTLTPAEQHRVEAHTLDCERCADLLAYAEKRRAYCPKDPKPFCSHCDTHCYKPEQAEYMREVMRYAGPRSLLKGHAVDGIRHVIEGRKAKNAAAHRAAATPDREESR